MKLDFKAYIKLNTFLVDESIGKLEIGEIRYTLEPPKAVDKKQFLLGNGLPNQQGTAMLQAMFAYALAGNAKLMAQKGWKDLAVSKAEILAMIEKEFNSPGKPFWDESMEGNF